MDSMDQNTMNHIKDMVEQGDLNGAISQISPEMLQNFSKMFSQQAASNQEGSQQNTNTKPNPDGNGMDMNQIMQLAANFNSQKNDPRNNLLNSLKPYLRDGKKEKLDRYMNLMNMSQIADILKNNPNMNSHSNSKQENP